MKATRPRPYWPGEKRQGLPSPAHAHAGGSSLLILQQPGEPAFSPHRVHFFAPALQHLSEPLISPQYVQRQTATVAPPSRQHPGEPLCSPHLEHFAAPGLQHLPEPFTWPHFQHRTQVPAFFAAAVAAGFGAGASASAVSVSLDALSPAGLF
jgi:hypothetical protein